MDKKKRIHDDLYLQDEEFKEKEYFNLIASQFHTKKGKLIDISCANGSVLSYLTRIHQLSFDLTGIDIHEGLLQKARINVPDARFFKGDIGSRQFRIDS